VFVLFKYLHILTMFAAVAAAFVPEIWLHAIARRGDVAALRGYLPLTARVGSLIPLLFLTGLVFGLLAAWAGELDFFQPWLIGAYIIFAIAMATGALVGGPWAVRMAAAADESGTDVPSPALIAAIHDRRGVISTTILMLAIIVIVWLMVAKPGA
jgi:Predicted integral membrane protein (DUF2269)